MPKYIGFTRRYNGSAEDAISSLATLQTMFTDVAQYLTEAGFVVEAEYTFATGHIGLPFYPENSSSSWEDTPKWVLLRHEDYLSFRVEAWYGADIALAEANGTITNTVFSNQTDGGYTRSRLNDAYTLRFYTNGYTGDCLFHWTLVASGKPYVSFCVRGSNEPLDKGGVLARYGVLTLEATEGYTVFHVPMFNNFGDATLTYDGGEANAGGGGGGA